MKLQLKSLTSICALAISLTTSNFAMEEEQDAAAHPSNGIASSLAHVGDATPLLLECWEGATVSKLDPLGIAGPGIRSRILSEARSLVEANSSTILYEAIYDAATKAAKDILCASNAPIFYETDQLSLQIRTIIANYISDPHMVDRLEAENSIVMAAAIRSITPVLSCTNNIRILLESSSNRLNRQLDQFDRSTLDGSISILQHRKLLDRLTRFVALVQDPEQTFFNSLRMGLQFYIPYYIAQKHECTPQLQSFSFSHGLPAERIQEFCRARGIPAQTTFAKCQQLFNSKMKLSQQNFKNRTFREFAHDDSRRVDFDGDKEERRINQFIERALTDTVSKEIEIFLHTHLIENMRMEFGGHPIPVFFTSFALSDD